MGLFFLANGWSKREQNHRDHSMFVLRDDFYNRSMISFNHITRAKPKDIRCRSVDLSSHTEKPYAVCRLDYEIGAICVYGVDDGKACRDE